MKKLWSVFLSLLLVLTLGAASAEGLLTPVDSTQPVYPYTWKGNKVVRRYETDTLKYTVETTSIQGCKCYVTKVWMKSPGQQIKKATAEWKVNIQLPEKMAQTIEGCALAVNASGYVSPVFPWIPENYPGQSEDYYYTPLGSLTITNGEVFRNLEGVPFYGLTLQEDGLHLHVGESNEEVLAQNPSQTWSFYVQCPMINHGEVILDETWDFAKKHAARTIIAKMDANNYVLITATSSVGLTLWDAVDFLQKKLGPEWAYDLDGGPSSALICRRAGKKTLTVIYGGKSKDADVMGFVELTGAE